MYNDPKPYLALGEWFQSAGLMWLLVMGYLLAAILIVGALVAVVRYGPIDAFIVSWRTVTGMLADLFFMSPRRIAALTWLTVKEAIRRRVVIVFAVFLALIAFAGWYIDPGSPDPARLYVSFVLSSTSYLVLLMALFLSAMSLPTDIKNKTIHTVVTKPVRVSEIVVGRVLGFTVVGTALLLMMGAISYVAVVRGVAHTHVLSEASLEKVEKDWSTKAVAENTRRGVTAKTSKVHDHDHVVYLDPSTETVDENGVRQGYARTDREHGHYHDVTYTIGADGKAQFSLGPPGDLLVARSRVLGRLRFKDRKGDDKDVGINVGDEWTYRTYVEGASQSRAIWTFEGVREEDFPNGLQVEMTLGVFRTHKGEIEKGVPGALAVRNPVTGKSVENARVFASKEFVTDVQLIPREFRLANGEKIDLFKDLVTDGKLEVWLSCVAPQQYFGVGSNDLYLRTRDASYLVNFFKGYLGIWMQMVLIIGFGVLFSTFLSGPIAIMATTGMLVAGLFTDFIDRLAAGTTYGGGPVESAFRLGTQQNMVTELSPSAQTTVMKMLDQNVFQGALRATWAILPDLRGFTGFATDVANGFDVTGDTMIRSGLQVVAFLVPLVVLGYLFLKSREVAK